MPSNKSSKKTINITEKSAAPKSEQISKDSKPLQRTRPAARTHEESSPAAKVSTPKKTSHRHLKASPAATPVVAPATFVVAEVVPVAAFATSAPENRNVVGYDDVARLAYSFWEERNYTHGFAEEDWQRALQTLGATA
jgi:hypothetical protein